MKTAPLFASVLVVMPWLLVTQSCSTATPTSGIEPAGITQEVAAAKTSAWDGFCAIATSITYSKLDSEQTKFEVRQHNHLGHIHCGWPE